MARRIHLSLSNFSIQFSYVSDFSTEDASYNSVEIDNYDDNESINDLLFTFFGIVDINNIGEVLDATILTCFM